MPTACALLNLEKNNMEIAGVEIPHPDKILYPDANITKQNIAEYYALIAKFMLPHIKERPLTLKQYPEGINKPGFFHKHVPAYFPKSIPIYTIPMHKEGATKISMVGAKTPQDLVYLAGQNTIELHMGLSRIKHIDKPDQIILDFDPSDEDFEKVRKVALITKDILDSQKLESFVKTTGSRGVHIHIPFKPQQKYPEVKKIAKDLAVYINSQCPDLTTVELRKNKRSNKVFIDYLRNDYAMTAVAAYSLRPNKNAGIATPITWEELGKKSLQPQSFTIKNIQKRLKNFKDPWAKFN